MTSNPLAAARLQIAQTRALVRLGQSSAATAMLINLAGQGDPQVARPAMALLGTLKLRQGAAEQGFNLLHRAVEQDSALAWPERTEAEANLGLAYLIVGDEPTGLRWLHEAQQSFESAGQRRAHSISGERGRLSRSGQEAGSGQGGSQAVGESCGGVTSEGP